MKTDWLPNSPWPRPKDGGGILQRLHHGDPTAVDDCESIYGEYVNQLAKYNMSSDEEAENAAVRIFDDIHAFARTEQGFKTRKAETELIRQIAVRSILKQRWDGRRVY